ncbi:DsbA family protein [Aquibacillus sp. 3ASR75-11]|uniref:DsbA family protein n=1 Tax=Terrihalobacillus insolitus TaxID=2950438 RepID=A0A9X4ALF8_9BACI|nr:DsbA family protein [Terrihalobacillus insolitus]MDC3414691.1 DsbA family protein [Terrihalobacillus insolitus]MDC3424196.1 DsbA family protein [Terrihalobacillus insolitus]
MTVSIKVYSDYVCPFCFIAEKPLQEAIKGKDVQIEWMPFELRPYPNETLKPEGEYLQNTWQTSVYPLAKKFEVDIVLPNVSPQPYTHLAFEGFQFAKENGKAEAYNHRMFQAFFQEHQNIGDIEILTNLAGEIGLDKEKYRSVLEERKYKQAHQAVLEHAANEANITAVPTMIIGDQTLRGLHDAPDIAKVIDEEQSKQPTISFEQGMACGPDGCF